MSDPLPADGRTGVAARRTLLLVGLLLLAANLRSAITSVGPVLGEITAAEGLSGTQAGLLTTLPVICFALAAPPSAWLARRIGTDRALLVAFVVVTVATAVRPLAGVGLLLAGSLVIGAAITVGNVLVPAVIKRDHPLRVGRLTAAYTVALSLGATLASGVTAPLAAVAGWRAALAAWALPSLAAAVCWWAAVRGRTTAATLAAEDGAGRPGTAGRVWRHPVAWWVAIFLGLQSACYFALTAWLVPLLGEEAGLDVATAGLAMAAFQVIGIVGNVLIPPVAARTAGQSTVAGLVGVSWGIPFVGLLLAPSWWPLWCVVAGFAQGAGLAMAIALIGLRAADGDAARELSSMSQTVGYALGAFGPLLMGSLADTAGGWTAALVAMLPVTAVMVLAGVRAGRDVPVG